MPVCRALGAGLWEVRGSLTGGRIARVIFCIVEGQMALLRGFIKKSQKTPPQDLMLARQRQKEMEP
jgi:phage-related protein